MNSELKFDHLAMVVKDISSRAEWYVENLGATIEYMDKTWAMLEVGGSKIALTLQDHHPPHTAFRVSSLGSLGSDYREHRDGSCYVYKCDPDGNTIELIYWRKDDGN